MQKYLFFILVSVLIIAPIIVFAAEWKWGDPLVICGTSATEPCTLCDIFKMAQVVVKFITTGLFIIAPIFIVIGGIRILIGGAKPDEVQSGKKMITNAIAGIVIALLAWVVLNMIFVQLAKEPGTEGIPWPWNKIQCVGGGIKEGTDLTYCHIQYSNKNDVMEQEYENNTLCYQGCSKKCTDAGNLCEKFCCLDRDLSGKNDVCESTSENQWCKRSASSESEKWNLSGIKSEQKGDASNLLTSFLNCMYKKIPGLIITSISDDKLCSGSCNPSTGIGCSHTSLSCHYGGTNPACSGFSYAIDFSTNISCTDIANAVLSSCSNYSARVLDEANHIHVSVNGKSCGCSETQTSAIQCK